jgi:hypothetical protein
MHNDCPRARCGGKVEAERKIAGADAEMAGIFTDTRLAGITGLTWIGRIVRK